jgi:hypothetical protein
VRKRGTGAMYRRHVYALNAAQNTPRPARFGTCLPMSDPPPIRACLHADALRFDCTTRMRRLGRGCRGSGCGLPGRQPGPGRIANGAGSDAHPGAGRLARAELRGVQRRAASPRSGGLLDRGWGMWGPRAEPVRVRRGPALCGTVTHPSLSVSGWLRAEPIRVCPSRAGSVRSPSESVRRGPAP